MDDAPRKPRKLMGHLDKLPYEAVQAGTGSDLPNEGPLFAERCKNICT
jgi:hypothetical protein